MSTFKKIVTHLCSISIKYHRVGFAAFFVTATFLLTFVGLAPQNASADVICLWDPVGDPTIEFREGEAADVCADSDDTVLYDPAPPLNTPVICEHNGRGLPLSDNEHSLDSLEVCLDRQNGPPVARQVVYGAFTAGSICEDGDNTSYSSGPCPAGTTTQLTLNEDGSTTGADQDGDTAVTRDGQVADDNCESTGEFSFALCPLLRVSNEAILILDERIRRSLEVNPEYFETNANTQRNPVREIWANFRNIAALLLIPVMLVIVISTALGFNIVDAYTVKRAMPRLLAAVIFMVLSFDICLILIEASTAVGRGVGGLIAAPFGGSENLTLQAVFSPPTIEGGADGGVADTIVDTVSGIPVVGGSLEALGGGVLAGISLAGIGTVGFVSIGILASFMFSAALALLLVFTVLIVREIVIVFMVAISPFAPVNWKLWWGTFTKLLLIYPIIFGLLVLGRGFASLLNDIGTGSSIIESIFFVIAKAVAYIGPFFLLLLVLKILTGVFGTVTGFVNDRSKGLFDRQKKWRGEKREELHDRAKAGKRYKGNTRFTQWANERAQRNVHMGAAGASIRPRTRTGRINAAVATTNALELDKQLNENKELGKLFSDDDIARAAAETNNAGQMRAYLLQHNAARFQNNRPELEAIVQASEAQRKKTGNEAFQATAVLSAIKGGTAYADVGEQYAAIARVTQDNPMLKGSMIAQARSMSESAGRMDAGKMGFGAALTAVNQFQEELQRTGDISDATTQNIGNNLIDNARDSSPAGHAIHGKPISARHLAESDARTANRLMGLATSVSAGNQNLSNQELGALGFTGDMGVARQQFGNLTVQQRENLANRRIAQHLASMAGLHDAMASSAPQNAREYANGLHQGTFDLTTVPNSTRLMLQNQGQGNYTPQTQLSVNDAWENLRSSSHDWEQMRRDFGAGATAQAQQYQQQQQAAAVGGGGNAAGGGPGGGPSDIRLKRNINLLTTARGFNIYRFQYLWSDEIYVGVMAQELLKSAPEALSSNAKGYLRVNYEALGLRMVTYQTWLENPESIMADTKVTI